MATPVKSVEEKVEDYFKKQLNEFEVKYFNKTDSINTSIDDALKNYNSKSGGKGNNYPDIKVLIKTDNQRFIPVMIEAKGRKGSLIKYDKNSDTDIDMSSGSVQKFAVNGAIHYAQALIEGNACEEALAVGINGYTNENNNLQTEVSVFYLSKKKHLFPLEIKNVSDLSFLKKSNLKTLIKSIDTLDLTENELENLKLQKEDELERKIHKIHQEIYDDKNLKTALQTNQKLFLFCGLIMAGLPIAGQADLTEYDFKGNETGNTDNIIVVNRIKSFLTSKHNTQDKIKLVIDTLSPVFDNKKLYLPINGESYIKSLFKKISADIIPCLLSELHLDFTGKIFCKLSDWVKIDNDKQNDVVLTPRYLTSFMAKLARTNKDSYVWDSAMGSAGFLVSAMEIMIADAKEHISDQEVLNEKIKSIKEKQILGIEILSNIYILAVLNMILMGDGSSKLVQQNSFEYTFDQKKFPPTVFLLNPPYSAHDKGLCFVKSAVEKMQEGYACVLIQENAGSGNGVESAKEILKTCTLEASIHLSDKIFIGKASVQTSIYLFKVNQPHNKDHLVTFIDLSNDGYSRLARKKSSQSTNLKDTDHAKERYQEVLDIVLNRKTKTNFYTEANGTVIKDVISLNGDDWAFSQHKRIELTPTIDDFKRTVADFLSWKVSSLIKDKANFQ